MSDDPNLSKNPSETKPKQTVSVLVIFFGVLGVGAIIIALLLPPVGRGREAARRTQCKNNLRRIGVALKAYESMYHALPPACLVDADGKPLHSWRTLILPFLDQQSLYERIDLTKPWDAPENLEAYKSETYAFFCPSNPWDPRDLPKTTYLAIVASNGCFLPNEGRKLSDITDQHSQTLMVIEVDWEHAVHWMSPQDADEKMVLSLGLDSKSSHAAGAHGLLVDGSVQFIDDKIRAIKRRALISISGNDK